MKKYQKIGLSIIIICISIYIGFLLRPVTADINRDGIVNIYDFNILMIQWEK